MYERRVRIIAAVTGVAYLVILVQLGRIQIIDAERYRMMAERKYTWDQLTVARRGRILDHAGEVLALDRPSFDLAVIVKDLRNGAVVPSNIRAIASLPRPEMEVETRAAIERLATREPMVAAISKKTGVDAVQIAEGLYGVLSEAARWGVSARPRTFLWDIPFEPWAEIKVVQEPPANGSDPAVPFPGLVAVHSARRSYPHNETACHILGYVGETDAAQWASLRHAGAIIWQGRERYRRWIEMLEGLAPSTRAEALDLVSDELGKLLDPEALAPTLKAVPHEERPGLAEEISGAAVTRAIRMMGPEQRERFFAALGDHEAEVRSWLQEPDRVQLTVGEHLWVRPARHLKDRTIGVSGIEAAQNEILRGHHGYKLLVRMLSSSGHGGDLEYLSESRPRSGGDVTLTLDLGFQRVVESLLRQTGRRGAAVFLDPADGAVVAMASSPGYNPDVFVPPRKPGAAHLVTGQAPGLPLLSRAIQGTYPLGSVFKPFVAAAALQEVERTHLTPASHLRCDGHLQSGPNTIHRCEGIHNQIAVREALARSCNVYFYKAGAKLGVDGLSKWARNFGFGERTGIDLTGEATGLVPSRGWKRAELGQGWFLSETYHFAIGQGYFTATPIQVARACAALANGGWIWRPYLVKGFGSAEPVRQLPIEPHIMKAVCEGMVDVTREPHGTAYSAFNVPLFAQETSFYEQFPNIAVAGKTGSAEHSRSRHGRTHAWFIGFAPADDPKLVFAVVLEEGGYGGVAAAPLAAEMLEAYFRTADIERHR